MVHLLKRRELIGSYTRLVYTVTATDVKMNNIFYYVYELLHGLLRYISWGSPFCLSFQISKAFWTQFCIWCTYDLEWPSWCGPLSKITCLFQVKVEVIPVWKSISTLNFQSPPIFSVVLTPAMYLVYDYWKMVLCDAP